MSDKVFVEHWAAMSKSAVVIHIFEGKITPVEVARPHHLSVAGVETWCPSSTRSGRGR